MNILIFKMKQMKYSEKQKSKISVWCSTSGQAQGSGKVLSLFLHTLRKLRDFRQCMTEVGRLVRRLSDTSSSSNLRRPIQFVAGIKGHRSNLNQTCTNKSETDFGVLNI